MFHTPGRIHWPFTIIMAPTMAMVILLKTNYSTQTAMATLAGLGLMGLLVQGPLLRWTEGQYAARKYKTVAGFKEN